MIRRTIMWICVGLAALSTVYAQNSITPYLSISEGYGFLESIVEKDRGGTTLLDIEFDHGAAIEASAGIIYDQGYGLFPVRGEVSFLYQQNNISSLTTNGVPLLSNEIREATLCSYMFNCYLGLSVNTPAMPYIMAGVGGVNVEIDDGAKDDVVAWQVGAGLEYPLTEYFILDFKYKYYATEKLDDDVMGMALFAHQVMMGMRFQL